MHRKRNSDVSAQDLQASSGGQPGRTSQNRLGRQRAAAQRRAGDPAGYGVDQPGSGDRARDPARRAGAPGGAGKAHHHAALWPGRPARTHPEGGGRSAGHFPELHLPAGKAHHTAAEGAAGGVAP
mgnify:CR=1 FL=1